MKSILSLLLIYFVYIFILATTVGDNSSPVRQLAPLPTYEEIVSVNGTNRFENDNDKTFLINEVKTELPKYEEALLM